MKFATVPETSAVDLDRLDRVEARNAVADLIHRYAQLVRYDRGDETADLYMSDGVFEVRRGSPDKPAYTVQSRVDGREAIRAYLLPLKGKPHPVPLVCNILVEVDGDIASSTCVMQARMSEGEGGFWGEYRDTCARVDGRWYFTSRTYTIFVDGNSN